MKKLKQWLNKKILAVLESEEAKELVIKSSSLLPDNIQKNREKISDFVVQYYQGTIEKKNLEPALKTLFILHKSLLSPLNCKKDFKGEPLDIFTESWIKGRNKLKLSQI